MRIDRVKFGGELARRCWTIKKLSEVCGVSRQTLGYIRQGKACSDEVGQKIAEGFNMPLTELIED